MGEPLRLNAEDVISSSVRNGETPGVATAVPRVDGAVPRESAPIDTLVRTEDGNGACSRSALEEPMKGTVEEGTMRGTAEWRS